MNSTMGDKGSTPPPAAWSWFNMYPNAHHNSYAQYQGHAGYYSPQQYCQQQTHHSGMPYIGGHHNTSPSLMGPRPDMKNNFLSAGYVMPFGQHNVSHMPKILNSLPNEHNDMNTTGTGLNQGNKVKEESSGDNSGNNSDSDSPPLPPRHAPPSSRFDNPPPPGTMPHSEQFYQPTAPIKFSFGPKTQVRPAIGGFGTHNSATAGNTGNSSNNIMMAGSNGKKKRKKRNRSKTSMSGGMNSSEDTIPPLPPHVLLKIPAPPLPPASPPYDKPPLPPSPNEDCNQITNMDLEESLNINSKNNFGFRNKYGNYVTSKGQQQNFVRSNNMLSSLECPQSLRNYMERCYSKCATPMDHDRVDIILKGKIMRASTDDSLWTKDWDNEPLPLLANELESVTLKAPSPQNSSDCSPPKKAKGLSAALESRLGSKQEKKFSRRTSRSPGKNRNSPKRRRDRSDSSSSSDDNYKSFNKSSKSKFKSSFKSKNDSLGGSKNKNKLNKISKSHFYSETGFVEDTNPELLEKRAARFGSCNSTKSSVQNISINSSLNSSFADYQSPLVSIRRKKGLKLSLETSNNIYHDNVGEFDLSDCHVIGICQDIEKPYLRLTAAPDASAVRPPEVLKTSLVRVKERWIRNQDYFYACEQLKSIRQDLTVQGIRDELTVKVYETHARIALEKGDHAEFNQCQSQLRSLYMNVNSKNANEFIAYRILYHIFTKDFMDLQTILASLTKEEKEDECIEHALKVRSAWWLCNYHRLFKLYKVAPRMSSYLMDWFMPRERKLALKAVIKSYRPNLAVTFINKEFGFGTEDDCVEFLGINGIVFADHEKTKIDCKASMAAVNGV